MRARDWDPTGERHGIPTYPWRHVPQDQGLFTKRQLRARGLRPGGQEPAAQILCRQGRRFAYLYREDLAKPVRPMTERRREALARAMEARSTCPECGVCFPYCLPLRTLGCCLGCAGEAPDAPTTPTYAEAA